MKRYLAVLLLPLSAWAQDPGATVAASALEASAAPAAAAPLPTAHLLFRLKLRMDRIDREYYSLAPPARAEQLDEAEKLIAELRGRTLRKEQQVAMFKTEMRLKNLRYDLARGQSK